MDQQHHKATTRPLLQHSDDDDDDGGGAVGGGGGDVECCGGDGRSCSSSSDVEYLSSLPNASSSAETRRLTSSLDNDSLDRIDAIRRGSGAKTTDGGGDYDVDDEDDADADAEDEDDPSVSVSLAKELLSAGRMPIDRNAFVYVVFYLLGMTTLLPWNFFITAQDYWMYKFRDITNSTAPGDLTPLQAGLTSDLGVAAAIPSTMFLLLNALIGHRIPLAFRMLVSMFVVLAFFVCTTVLVRIDTDAWQHDFFVVTLATVVVMNMATAILSGGLFGICGQFPSEYVTAVVSGQALGGIFAALAQIVSLTFGASPTVSAFAYFCIGNTVVVMSIVSYVLASRTAFFRYHTVDRLALQRAVMHKEAADHRRHLRRMAAAASSSLSSLSTVTPTGEVVQSGEPQFGVVLRKIWLHGLAEWLVFVGTLCVYPSVTVLVSSQNHGSGYAWNDIYFVPVVNYLIFNSGDYLGRILAGMIEWPHNRPAIVFALSVLRLAFVPALLLCNANPRHTLPTLIHADYAFIVLMAAFAFSNGYLANIAMIWAPKSVATREREMASAMMAAFLGVGLAFGSTIGMVMVRII